MNRILIVDDDKGFRFLLGEYLGAREYECTLAGDAEQALEYLKNNRYDLVLSDFHMPGESGLELLRRISSEYPGTHFILMTASCDRQLRREALKMGAWECIEKPFRLLELLGCMNKALASRVPHFPKELVYSAASHAI